MNIKCPNCGAVHSLDSLITSAEGAALMSILAKLDATTAQAALQYLGLFRPAKSQLTFARAAKLLGELIPDIQAGNIKRDGVMYSAPTDAWVYGFHAAIVARNEGRLKLPLKSHGYLYEIITGWKPQESGGVLMNNSSAHQQKSKTLSAVEKLEGLKL